MEPVTIRDVARRAGVSPTTVSHVLTGHRPVNETTRERVQQVMDDLGYVPHVVARGLRLQTTSTVALIVPDISNPYFATLARGAADAAESKGYRLGLFHSDWRADRERNHLEALRGGGADALVYAAGSPPDHRLLGTLAARLPLAVVDEELSDVSAVTVVADNYKGGALAGGHLAQLGHRRVLELSGPTNLATARLRHDGFQSVYSQITGSTVEERAGKYVVEHGYEATRAELTEHGSWFSAIFAGNDLIALGAIRALLEQGLRIPLDVSVVGFDDADIASVMTPALTTVAQPVYDMGYRAVDLLLTSLSNPALAHPSRLTLDVELVLRATTSKARVADKVNAPAVLELAQG